MKRLISFFVLSALVLSFSSCQKQKTLPKTEMKTEYKDTLSYVDKKYSIYELQSPVYFGTEDIMTFGGDTVADLVGFYRDDMFVGKVVAAEKIIPKLPLYYLHRQECTQGVYCDYGFTFDKKYAEYYSLDDDIYIYTVEIETVINAVFTVEKTTVWVIDGVAANEKPYQVGQKYLLCGRVCQYGDKTVLRVADACTSKVDSEGNIECIGGKKQAEVLNAAGNVQNILSDPEVKALPKKDIYIAPAYKEDYGGSAASEDVIVEDIKKALVTENNFRMKITPQFYDWPEGYEEELYEKYYPDK